MNEKKNRDDQYNIFLNYHEPKKTNKANKFPIFLAFLSVLFCIALGLYLLNSNSNIISKLPFLTACSDLNLNKENVNFNLDLFNNKQNILILGVDANQEGGDPFIGTRSDTILLIHIEPKDKSISAISIPRDSKVYIPGNYGVQKINSAHAFGGVELAKKTVEQTLGVKIDRYIAINNEAVIKMVDALDGIPIYVEKDMRYRDNSGHLHVKLSKGYQILNGKQAEGYLRYRKDGLGDIGRTSRQQWFLRSLLEKMQSPSVITKVPEVLKIAERYIKTDMSLYEMSNLAAMAKNFDMSKIEVATLPGAPSKKGYISYWILDPEKTQEVINRMIYNKKQGHSESLQERLSCGILYSRSNESKAKLIKEKLEYLGYDVNANPSFDLPHSQIIGHNQSISHNFLDYLKQKVPELHQIQMVYAPIKMYNPKNDFTIILSDS